MSDDYFHFDVLHITIKAVTKAPSIINEELGSQLGVVNSSKFIFSSSLLCVQP